MRAQASFLEDFPARSRRRSLPASDDAIAMTATAIAPRPAGTVLDRSAADKTFERGDGDTETICESELSGATCERCSCHIVLQQCHRRSENLRVRAAERPAPLPRRRTDECGASDPSQSARPHTAPGRRSPAAKSRRVGNDEPRLAHQPGEFRRAVDARPCADCPCAPARLARGAQLVPSVCHSSPDRAPPGRTRPQHHGRPDGQCRHQGTRRTYDCARRSNDSSSAVVETGSGGGTIASRNRG